MDNKIIIVDINDEMRKSFLDYSMSVIVSRALPDARDGLKPVHRRILYTLFENNLTAEKPYRKCADTFLGVCIDYEYQCAASAPEANCKQIQILIVVQISP